MHRIQPPKVYNRIYQNFAGVDFSSDHTLVKPYRMPYAVNVYKDYKSSQEQAIETFPGFEKVFRLPLESAVLVDTVEDVGTFTDTLSVLCEDYIFSVTKIEITNGEETTELLPASEAVKPSSEP